MPIYEFKCSDCEQIFEELMKFDDSIPQCIECASDNVERLISKNSFHLKGIGWYKTDYQNK